MADELKQVDIRTRAAWRQWLEKNNKKSPGIWIVCHKKHAGVPSLSMQEVVEEALCFGWIDSLVRKLDDDRYLRKVTPRRPRSVWSDTNRKIYKKLKAAGRLAPAGEAAAPTGKTYGPLPPIPDLPDYIERAFKANSKAWKFFETLSKTDRRYFVGWIHTAKRPETREKRIMESLRLLAAGKKLGLK